MLQKSFAMKCSLIVLILSFLRSAISEALDRYRNQLDLQRLADSALRARSMQNLRILQKRTLPLRKRGTCGSTERCAKAPKSHHPGIQMQSQRRPQQQQETASSPLITPPRHHSMVGHPAPVAPRRSESPPPSPKTETIIHSESSSLQSSPREGLLPRLNRLVDSSSFESRLSRETYGRPLPGPDPVPISIDETGRFVPKRTASPYR